MEQVPTRTRTVSGIRQAGTLVTGLARQVEGKATVEDGTQEKETNMEDGKETTAEGEQEGEKEGATVDGEIIEIRVITHPRDGAVKIKAKIKATARAN